ncbi:MAG: PD40 domain-containing protein [Deltaproteobacteria bacterium]|nr:MAG: PD40 domain-containing protein [Deltaproteobacteria bacterium]
MAATAPESVQVFTSPDQSWRVEVIRYECTLISEVGDELAGVPIAYEQLLLTGPDGKVTPVAEQRQFCGGLGAAGINGLFWSPDGKYFYFDMAREGVPDGMPCRSWFTRKSRLNIETLEVDVLPGRGLPGKDSLSPDGSSLLLVGEPHLILWDLNQGEVGRSAHPYLELSVKSIALSADGSRVVYVLRQDCIQPGADSVVVVLNLADLTHTIVLESSDPSILQATWESDDSISLVDYNGVSFELSLSTGDITPR